MTASEYLPDTGDLIWTDFDPTKGREQAGRRPALVVSPATFTREHRPGDRLPDYVARAAVPDQRRSTFEIADRRRNPDQPHPQHRYSGPANSLCRRRRLARNRAAGPGETQYFHHDLRVRPRPGEGRCRRRCSEPRAGNRRPATSLPSASTTHTRLTRRCLAGRWIFSGSHEHAGGAFADPVFSESNFSTYCKTTHT